MGFYLYMRDQASLDPAISSTCADDENESKTGTNPLSNSITQYQMGLKYLNGDQVEQNYDEALKWFQLSADQNNIYAHMMLYQMYTNGEGVDRDEEIAQNHLQFAAEHGHHEALVLLIHKYATGDGVEIDKDQVIAYLTQSGDIDLIMNIADKYEKGDGFEKDVGMAYKLYKLALSFKKNLTRNQETAIHNRIDGIKPGLANIYYERAFSDQEQKIQWLKLASEFDHADAAYILGDIYEHDNSFASDSEDPKQIFYPAIEEAIKYYKIAAQHGHTEAQYRLGHIYEDPDSIYHKPLILNNDTPFERILHSTPSDIIQARHWYGQAATQNHIEALYRLGIIYEEKLPSPDIPTAVVCYQKAAELGHYGARQRLENVFNKKNANTRM